MGSSHRRLGAVIAALAALLLSIAGIINAGPAKSAINPGTGCGEDSFLGSIAPPSGSTVHPGDLVGATYQDESVLYNPTDPADARHVQFSIDGNPIPQAPLSLPSPEGPNTFIAPGGSTDMYTLKSPSVSPVKEKFSTDIQFKLPASLGRGDHTIFLKAWDSDNNKPGGDCGAATWTVTIVPAKIILHKTDDHVPPNPLAGAVFGLWAGNTTAGNPVANCTSQPDGTCTFDNLDAGTYTTKETSAPAGYSPDPATVTVTVGLGETKDVTQPFVDPRDTGWARIVKVLQDNNGNPVPVADKHVLDGAAFVLYTDKNNSGSLDPGETAKLWPAETTDAACVISGGTGSCDIGPVVPGNYRVHETQAPPNTTAGPDVDVTIVKSTKADPVIVNYVNIVGGLDITLIKGGPALAHVGDTFTYTFDASTSGPRLHNVTLTELAPNRCSGPISAATGDTNNNGFLDKGETWHWTCDHTVSAADPNPLPNTAKVTGTDDFGRSVSDTDDHSVIIIHPAIVVVKSGAAQAHEGDTVTYSFKVTNTGDAALSNVSVIDDKLGSVGTIPLLSAGDTVTLTKDFVVPAGTEVTNTVTACGTDPLALKVCDDDHHKLIIVHPAIEVIKSGPALAHVGDKVTYSFKVTNKSDTALTNVTVTDDKLGAIGTIASLAVGESKTLTADFTVPDVASVENTVTACGTDPLAKQVCDDDHHKLITIHPNIQVIKSGPVTAHVGDTITYSFKVTNTGDTDLTNVAVTDDKLGPIGTIGALAVGESKTLTKDFVVPDSSVTNVATACGDDPLSKKVCDDDHHKVDPIHPAIHIVKSGPALAHVGDTITYVFEVTNAGDVPLHDVVLTDPKCNAAPVITAKTANADDILDLGDHWSYDCTHKVTASDADPLPNTGTVTGTDPLDKKVTDSDDHTVDIIHPAIQVLKSGPAQAHEGDKVTYSFAVTNTGDVDLAAVAVNDDKLGAIGTIPALAVGQTKTLTKDFVIPTPSTSDIENTVTACGTDPLSTKVCDDDHHKLTPKHPRIDVLKRGPATASAGQVVTYTFVVTNTGDIDLTNVAVNDDKLGAIGTIPALAVGQSVTLSKDFTVPAGVVGVDNIVTACGTDTLALQVCDTDNHHMDVTQVLGETFTPPTLAVTGRNLGSGLVFGMLLVLGGFGLRRMRRRGQEM